MSTDTIAPRMREKTVNVPAELSLLGSLLLSPELMEAVDDLLQSEDFYYDAHSTIYTAMHRLYSKHQTPYLELVVDILKRQGVETLLSLDTGRDTPVFDYLIALEGYTPYLSAESVAALAKRIAFLSQMRALAVASERLRQIAESGEEDALEQAEALVLSLGNARRVTEFTSLGDYFPTYLEHLDAVGTQDACVRGVPTGYSDLDALLGGLQPGGLYIIGAQSRIGKTTLCQNILYNAATRYGKRGGFFSCEMNLDELMDRFVAIHTAHEHQPLNSLDLRTARLSEEQKEYLIGPVCSRFEDLGIFIAHTPGITLDALVSRARRLVKQQHLDILIVDYLQLLRAHSGGKRIANREQEIAEIARGLKILAGELGVPVIAPAQLNREVGKEASTSYEDDPSGDTFKIPQLWHLRESGELEQSANVVMFLARAEKHEEHVKLVVAKHRNGDEGEFDLYFEGKANCFYPMAERGITWGN